ncbi:TIGR02530 family flagellar biosynthesis protein [Thalassobacillus pellis]|uniref:TIGR02530 family flagellar biosynthesis protein n=1 Tax=Thalassobacillus pellis TaxID=748008 RepID=UPI001960F373|nr:TIGR02530 family flagellar biosynthesis protein [Thalassobacillus pellis]MBM7552745.1 flagellar operon protein [Thalassobacillus pellis]
MDPRIHQLHQAMPLPRSTAKQLTSTDISFKNVLDGIQGLKVSKHANQRLSERNIAIDEVQWNNIQTKMTEARQKGITDSLVVLKDAALVVSTKNNTVVTAMDRKEATDHIFTNINGTILLED